MPRKRKGEAPKGETPNDKSEQDRIEEIAAELEKGFAGLISCQLHDLGYDVPFFQSLDESARWLDEQTARKLRNLAAARRTAAQDQHKQQAFVTDGRKPCRVYYTFTNCKKDSCKKGRRSSPPDEDIIV